MSGLDTAATGMQAQQLMIDVESHNLANTNTTAFDRRNAHFKDLMYINRILPGGASNEGGGFSPRGMQIGLGVRAGEVYRINTVSSFIETGNDLDIAIRGNGYLVVDIGNGETAYTRDGSLSLNNEGLIVTSDGNPIVPNITVPVGSVKITINKNGQIEVLSSTGEQVIVGNLEFVRFVNEGGLADKGDNLFTETTSSGPPETGSPGKDGYGDVLQYYLESSNVDPIHAITNLIRAQRAYEMNAKALQTNSEVEKAINDIRT